LLSGFCFQSPESRVLALGLEGNEPEARWGFQLGLPPALEHKKQCGWLSVIKTK